MRAIDHWQNATIAKPTNSLPEISDQKPHGLPIWAYRSERLAALELERVFRSSWQVVGHVNSLPKAGDFLTIQIGGDNIFVIRDKEGKIHALHNICRHRASRLVEGDRGNCGASLVCPYHGWSYDHSGALRAIPYDSSFFDLHKDKNHLYEAHIEIVMGLIFVAISKPNYSVAEKWQPIMELMAPYRIEDMVPLGEVVNQPWDINWKVAFENYLESYHVPKGHPGLFRMFIPDFENQNLLENGLNVGSATYREQLSTKWSERHYQKLSPLVATHLPEPYRKQWRFISLLPNMGFDIFPDQIDFFQILPVGAGKTIGRQLNLGLVDDRREMKLLRYLGQRINNLVQAEDDYLCKLVQKNLSSTVYRPGALSKIEACMVQFQNHLREAIPQLHEANEPKW